MALSDEDLKKIREIVKDEIDKKLPIDISPNYPVPNFPFDDNNSNLDKCNFWECPFTNLYIPAGQSMKCSKCGATIQSSSPTF